MLDTPNTISLSVDKWFIIFIISLALGYLNNKYKYNIEIKNKEVQKI